MFTPYQILQLKQKQRKKFITQSQRQRSFSVRYQKNSQNITQYYMQKGKTLKEIRNKTLSNDKNNNHLNKSNQKNQKQKKYQIVFRQSIRKNNAYRKKVYHTHTALRNESFINKYLMNTKNEEQIKYHTIGVNNLQPQQIQMRNFTQQNENASRSPKNNYNNNKMFLTTHSKRLNPEQKLQTMSVGKYKIIFTPKGQNYFINQIVPPQFISGQKCKILTQPMVRNIKQNKQKIQKAIRSLYNHSKEMENKHTSSNITSLRKGSLDGHYITYRENYSEQDSRKMKNKFINYNVNASQVYRSPQKECLKQIIEIKSPRSTTELKNKIKFMNIKHRVEQDQQQTISILENNSSHFYTIQQSIDDTKVANFIKNKKKKRIPLTLLKPKPKFFLGDNFQFRRTITDDSYKNNFIKTIENGYYSPKKRSNLNASKIKFNSIEDKLTGWDAKPTAEGENIQNMQNEETIKNLMSSGY